MGKILPPIASYLKALKQVKIIINITKFVIIVML